MVDGIKDVVRIPFADAFQKDRHQARAAPQEVMEYGRDEKGASKPVLSLVTCKATNSSD
jgi:hypothetical protein